MIRIVILIVLTIISLALHVPTVNNHLQTPLNSSANATEQNMLYFNNSFISVQNKVDYVRRTLKINDSDSDNFKFIISRCQQIQAGLRVLQSSLIKYNLLISQKNTFCPKVSTFNRTEIRRFMVYTQQKQGLISSFYPTCLECSFIIPDLNKILQGVNKLFRTINRTLDGQYCNYPLNQKAQGLVNLNNSYFKNNLNVDNWYYGSTTQSDYKIYIFKRLSTYNMTDCPLNKPFVKEAQQICFNCPEGSIYNLGKQQCIQCSNNQYFDIVTDGCKQCLGSKKTVNHTIICQPCILAFSQFYNATSGQCYKCDNKTSFIDQKMLTCKLINCSNTTPRFNVTTQLCEQCGAGQIVSPTDKTICIKTNFIGICPTITPIYDESTHLCTACPQNTAYNQSLKRCQANITSVST